MRCLMLSLLLLCSVPAFSAEAPSGAHWVTASEFNEFIVVVSEGASPSEKFAAEEFARYWERCTGLRIPVAATPLPGRINVFIGEEGARFLDRIDTRGLGDDGFCIHTVELNQDLKRQGPDWKRRSPFPLKLRDLLIVGGRQRGTLYGVYQFFHDAFGVRWLTPEVTHIPPTPEGIPYLDERQVPAIPYRETNYWIFTRHPEFAAVHRLNGNAQSGISEERGGYIGYAGGFGHTFYTLLPPEVYFAEHPEYFSLVDGVRQPKSQLCLTNPEVLDIVTGSVLDILRSASHQNRIVSITQMDWPFWCECASCAALDAREESHAGALIHFVNAVAARVEHEFPTALVDTFAYTWSRKPPKHVHPRDNVIVRLCSIEGNFFKPLADRDDPHNRSFREDIEGWAKITKHLWIWDYTQNWHAFLQPHPNIQVIQPNTAFFAENGVSGVFEQAAHSPGADFEYLKAYIVAQSLWNTGVDWRALYDEFLTLYYGPAAPYIREYHALITGKVAAEDYSLGIFSKMEWMDYETIITAQAIFDRGLAQVHDPVYRERLDRARLPVQYAALVAPPRVTVVDSGLLLERPPSQSFDEFWAMIQGYGVSHLEDKDIQDLHRRLGGLTPPRQDTLEVVRLENDAYALWVAPALRGAVISLIHKATGLDLFAGAQAAHGKTGTLEEWDLMDPAAPLIEEPVADRYTVTRRSPESVTVEARLEKGLVLARTITLPPGEGPVSIQLALRNEGNETLVPRVKLHPEFLLGAGEGTLHLRREGQWQAHELQFITGDASNPSISAERLAPGGADAWAVELPGRRLYLVNTFIPEELSGIYYFHDRSRGQMNLELLPDQKRLERNEVRFITTEYFLHEELPE